MIKILFLINTLGGGGAEKVLVNLVNNMDYSKFDITVETMFDDGVNAKLLNKEIRYISKKALCPRGIAQIFRFFSSKQLFKFFIGDEKYDILVAYMHGAPVKVISGCTDKHTKKISWLHNGNPATGTFFKFWFSEKNAIKVYEKLDAVVGVSNSVSKAFSDYTKISENIITVYNTNDVKKIIDLSAEKAEKDKSVIDIMSVGRISHEKGYLRFFEVCNKLKKEYREIKVTVIGSGEEENELRTLVEKNNASDWFILTGFQCNPYKYLANADLFVCPSYVEGLSTAVTEAIILGIPSVSTDVSGAKEILGENNEYGIVVDNSEEGLFNGMKMMLSDIQIREDYREKANKRAEFFKTENTVRQAEKLFMKYM